MTLSRAILLAGVSLSLACVGRMADQLKTDLVGLDASDLRVCLGAPENVDRDAAGEVWVYRRAYPHRPEDVSIADNAAVTPNVPHVGAAGSVDRGTSKSTVRRADPDAIPAGACLLFFVFEEGRVGSFDAAGRSHEGVSAPAECALLARSCRP